MGAGEVASAECCLSSMRAWPQSPQLTENILQMLVCLWGPLPEGKDRQRPGTHWPARLPYVANSRPTRVSVSNKIVSTWDMTPKLSSILHHTHTPCHTTPHMCTHTHDHTPEHIYKHINTCTAHTSNYTNTYIHTHTFLYTHICVPYTYTTAHMTQVHTTHTSIHIYALIHPQLHT